MKIDQLPDGWHVISDDGTTMGPFESLTLASECMDLLENRRRLEQTADAHESAEPVRGIVGRLGQAFSRHFGFAPTALPPVQHHAARPWSTGH